MGDRLIPIRSGNSWQMTFHIKEDQGAASSGSLRNNDRVSGVHAGNVAEATAGDAADLFCSILENKVLDSGIEDPRELLNRKRRVLNVIYIL